MRKDSRTGSAAVAWVAIQLTQGKVTLIDWEDFEKASKYTWQAVLYKAGWYAAGTVNGKRVHLHRFLMNAPSGIEVDHINGDGLDNRRSTNLRFATHAQNNQNTFRKPTGSVSRYKGVGKTHKRYWRARIKLGGKQRHLGMFPNEEAAARAYDAAALEHFGEFARLNFPAEMPAAGLEPAAYRSGGGRSNPLSYAGTLQQGTAPMGASAETLEIENVSA